MRASVAAVALAFLLSALTMLLPGDGVDATDPYDPPQLMHGLHPDPGSASYSLCTNDVPTQWLWAWGPESWETATEDAMNWVFVVNCNFYVREQLQWEYYFMCEDDDIACHHWYDGEWHTTSENGYHWHALYSKIAYDHDKWHTYDNATRREISAHEMGHGSGLEDHDGVSQCTALTIMGQLSVPPCYEQPTFWDAIAAMNTHGYFQ